MNKRRISGLVGLIIGVLGLAFVTIRLIRDWSTVVEAFSSARWLLAVGALAVGLLGMTTIGLNWHRILRDLGFVANRRRTSLHQYFVGQLGKYIPGGIWPIVGRAEMAHRGGATRSAAYAGTLLSLGSTYLAGLLTAAAFLAVLGLGGDEPGWTIWLVAIIPIGLLALHPSVLTQTMRWASRISKRQLEVPIPKWSRSVTLVVLHIPAWLAISAATYLVSESLGGGASFGRVVVATSVAWFLGFVVIGLPGGIGVREAVFVSLVSPMDPAIAAAVALVSRVVFIVVDLAGAGLSTGWHLSSPQRKTEI